MASTAYRSLLEHELRRTDARSITTITTYIIADARMRNASDIHIDPIVSGTHIRLRIDGLLSDSYGLPANYHTELIARLKIVSRLRTDEHFSPQDGSFYFASPSGDPGFDVRLSIIPTQYGESAVLRLLIPPENSESLAGLGMKKEQELTVEKVLTLPYGFVLIVGPTGSGKTTTLYALIRRLIGTKRSVVSIEDPIEYSVPGMRQVQVVPRHGLTFADGLRSLLRQDPDVIVIGELRDAETANLALNAAHTGHLVLSTLHSTSAAGAFARLEELEVSAKRIELARPFVIAQNLIRTPGISGRTAEFELLYAENET